MKLPTKDKSELYPLTETEHGVVHVTDSGKYRVVIWPNESLLRGEKFIITSKDDSMLFTATRMTIYTFPLHINIILN